MSNLICHASLLLCALHSAKPLAQRWKPPAAEPRWDNEGEGFRGVGIGNWVGCCHLNSPLQSYRLSHAYPLKQPTC